MKKLILVGLTLIVANSTFAQQQSDNLNPGSLWPHKYTNPLLDRTARNVGDLLTVIISETSTANFTATTKTSRDQKGNVGNINMPLLTGLFKALGIDSSVSTNGSGTTSQSGNFTAKMTVVVKQVLANGNLVIEGERMVRVNKDWQLITLTGIVRRDDVRPDNTVLSSNIANAQIRGDGKGQISDKQRRGWLTRLLEAIF